MPVRRVRRRHAMYAAPQQQSQSQPQQKQKQQKGPKSDPPPPPSAEAGPSRLFDTPDLPPPPPYEARDSGECERHRVLDPTRPVHDYGAVGAAK